MYSRSFIGLSLVAAAAVVFIMVAVVVLGDLGLAQH